MDKKVRAAIVGYGNIGRYVIDTIAHTPDFEIAGIVRRNVDEIPVELREYEVTDSIANLTGVDVAILCLPSRLLEDAAKEILEMGINTVDSFDIHPKIVALKKSLNAVATKHNAVSIVSSGWDPGSNSIVRVLMQAMAPSGITYTNFGPGMSMGHSVAVKAFEGVRDALSVTIPTGTGIHRRMVYIELEDGYELKKVSAEIKNDAYFVNDETHVFQVDDVNQLKDMGHGVAMERKGASGSTQNQLFTYGMRINNPALTAQMLVNAARAVMKQQPGAYTLIEIPWPLNGNANDLSGAGRHGSPAVITWGRPGVGDGETAAGFNGVNSYISLPVASDPFSSITWSMMVYFRAQSWIGGLERRMLRLQFNVANPNVHIMPTKTAADNQVAIGNFTYRIEDNNWHSLIVVRSGFSYIRYYIDNALIVQRSPYALSGSELLMGVIGAHTTSPTLSWLGDLAHIAVWAGRALTDEEVQELTAWRPTITDRTQEDITNKTTKAYWNLADWERVTFNTNMVRARIATLGGLETPLHELATPTMSTYPRAQDINHLIDNIQRVRAGAAVPLAPLRRDYESGLGAVVPDYTAANEWERVLEALRFAVPHAARCFVSCGVATAGQSRPWQSQFRG